MSRGKLARARTSGGAGRDGVDDGEDSREPLDLSLPPGAVAKFDEASHPPRTDHLLRD